MLRILFIVICCFTPALLWVNLASAEEKGETVYPQAYDGFQASQDAQQYWDARRRDAVNRQLGWNELFKWRAAAAQTGELYYEPYVPTPLAYAHAPFFGDFQSGWPYSIGRIVGYGYYNPVPQPIGRREVQTGPNRWESFPIYADEIETRPLPKRSVIAPPNVLVPAPPRGREF